MKYYCPKCFYKNEYKFKKPEKCAKCGFLLTASIAEEKSKVSDIGSSKRRELEKRISIAERTSAVSDSDEEFDYEDDYDGSDWKDGFDKLSRNPGVEFEFAKSSSISLGDAVKSGKPNEDFPTLKRSTTNKIDNKKILEELKREASSNSDVLEID